ncbi:hypothetical protein GGF32_005629 [Allomyces javanicus]|nr:hypothetical protein GGF32_005629 [Allomyces javanicus]
MAGPPATPSSTTPAAAATSTTAASDASQPAQAQPVATTAASAPATATNTASDAPAASNGGNMAALSAQMQAMQPFGAPQPAAAHMIHPMYATAALAYPNAPAGAAAGAPYPFPGYAHHPGHHAPQAGYPAQGETPATNEAKTTLWMGLEPWMDDNYVRSLWNGIVSGPGFAELAAPSNAAGTASAGASPTPTSPTAGGNATASGNNGNPDKVTVKMIRDKYSGSPASYCFVDFGTHELAAKCVTLDATPLPNLPETHFRLNWASGGGLIDTKAPEYSIFVGDLAPDVTDDVLMQAFSARYPSCKTAKVVVDAATGNSRGFGFVRFSDQAEQLRALAEMPAVAIGSRPIRVGLATPKQRAMNHGGAGGGSGYYQHQHQHRGAPHHAHMPVAHHQHYASPAAQAARGYHPTTHLAPNDPNNTTVFIGGLTNAVSEDEIRAVFASQGEITQVKIPVGKNCAFVSYTHRESAEKAIVELNGYAVGNNKIRLGWGRPNANAHNGHPAAHGGVVAGAAAQHAQHAHHPAAYAHAPYPHPQQSYAPPPRYGAPRHQQPHYARQPPQQQQAQQQHQQQQQGMHPQAAQHMQPVAPYGMYAYPGADPNAANANGAGLAAAAYGASPSMTAGDAPGVEGAGQPGAAPAGAAGAQQADGAAQGQYRGYGSGFTFW